MEQWSFALVLMDSGDFERPPQWAIRSRVLLKPRFDLTTAACSWCWGDRDIGVGPGRFLQIFRDVSDREVVRAEARNL
jgi:hypothetical protein